MRLGTLMTDLGPNPPAPEPDDLPDSGREGADRPHGPADDLPDPTAPEDPVPGGGAEGGGETGGTGPGSPGKPAGGTGRTARTVGLGPGAAMSGGAGDPGGSRPGQGNGSRVPFPSPRSAADDGDLPLLDGSGPPPPEGPGPATPDPADPGDLSWAEDDWSDALMRARRAGRAYVYLNLVEQRLRAVVREVLQPVYGTVESAVHDDGAWVVAAAGPTQSEWVERAEAVREMSRRRGYIVDPADDDLVAFLTLPQLRELLVRNWWCFAPYLSDRRSLERALEEVEIGRHIVARNRVLSPDVLRQVERACTRVLAELDGRLGRHAGERLALDAVEELFSGRYGDLVAVFPDRSSLQRKLPFADLVGEANAIDAMGVSLNLLCQNYSGRELHRLAAAGCRMRLLFLNPAGDAMRQREKDEGVKRGILSRLTTLNILHARKIRAKLAEPARIEIRLYEETPRFNAYLVDGDAAVVQPYLRRSRGVESPSFVMRSGNGAVDPRRGLFALFQEEFDQLWEAGKRTA